MIMKDCIYKFRRTENLYKVIDIALMKNPVSREWEECVIYEQYKHYDDGAYFDVLPKMTFVRELTDFNKLFTKIDL